MFIKRSSGIMAIIEEDKLTNVQKTTAQILTNEVVRIAKEDNQHETSDNIEKKLEN